MGLRSFFGFLPPSLPLDGYAANAGSVPMPEQAVLLLPGAGPEHIAVKSGDEIETGQDLAIAGSGPLVATVTGRVARVACVTTEAGQTGVAVTIEVAPVDTFSKDLQPLEDLEGAEPEALRAALLRAGLPGLAAFQAGARLATVIVSALEEAPGCMVNSGLLADHDQEIAAGLRLYQRASGAGRMVLAIAEGATAPAGLPAGVQVVKAPARYPNGLPEILALRQGGWLFQQTAGGMVGDTLVVGLEVLLASVNCLREGRPYLEKTVSCRGPEDRQPRNLKVRIGTPAAKLLQTLDLTPQTGGKLLLSSPLRGVACPDLERPVLPQTQQLILQAPAQVHHFLPTPCTNCGLCDQVCPVDLEVSSLGRYAEYDRYDRCADLAVERCVDCGLCAYVCPAHRPLAQLMMHAKQTLWHSPERRQEPIDTAGCNACGPTCPAIRLFDLDPEPAASGKEKQA